MRTWPEVHADPAAWGALARASDRLLVLDFDGTLSPFVPDPAKAAPYPGVRERLEALLAADCCRLVFVTGRECRVLLRLLGLSRPVEVWGSHGGERLLPDGRRQFLEPDPGQAAGLAEAACRVRELGLEGCLEPKPGCLAFHLRGLDPAAAPAAREAVRAAWSGLARRAVLDLHDFDGGLELRLPGADKGRAVRTLLAESLPGAVLFYLGDDRTDEDAFAALAGHGAGRGVGVLVRPEPRSSRAAWHLVPPAELLAFLDAFAAACAPAAPAKGPSLP